MLNSGILKTLGEGIPAMPLVCPQCKQLFEQNGLCPLCNVVLLYHAQNLKTEPAPSAKVEDESSQWQQTPWGKIIIGLILPLLALTSGAAEYQVLAILTSLSALAGLFLWEHIWVQAGQAVPLS